MKSNFRFRLFLIMIVFAVLISFTITTINYLRERSQATDNHEMQVEQIETTVTDSISMIDKAYHYFDEDTRKRMVENTQFLLDLYNKNPDVASWDYHELKETLGMDVYIIDKNNTVVQTSYTPDLGLNFSACCSEFSSLLDERREDGDFFADGMDLQQKTGEIKKFSYQATPDKEYIIELGYSLEEGTIFNEFNFLHVMEDLVSRYPSLSEVNLLNTDGFLYGEESTDNYLPEDRQEAFLKALESKDTVEVMSQWHEEDSLYRYVYYEADTTLGISTKRVIELIYNDYELQSVLKSNTKSFVLQLLIILSISIIVAFIISKWMSRPMYLAFHDSLTELKNRAAFEETMESVIQEERIPFAVFMVDLDNFKLVNDYLGHDQGDFVLQQVAQAISNAVPKHGSTFRLGGDEFAIIIPDTSRELAEEVAIELVDSLKKSFRSYKEIRDLNVTASIGISIGLKDGLDGETLLKKADIALYKSKEKGKNSYAFYNGVNDKEEKSSQT